MLEIYRKGRCKKRGEMYKGFDYVIKRTESTLRGMSSEFLKIEVVLGKKISLTRGGSHNDYFEESLRLFVSWL
jgi:hypothetical protein